MYRYLNDDGKIIVPLMCALFFLYFYFKYKKDKSVPARGARGNIFVFVGCILLSLNELMKQNHFPLITYISPFIGLDFCNLFLVLGACMFLVAASKHEKYKNKIMFRYILTVYLVLLIVLYVFARVMYW